MSDPGSTDSRRSFEVKRDGENICFRAPCARALCRGWARRSLSLEDLVSVLELFRPIPVLGQAVTAARTFLQMGITRVPEDWTGPEEDQDMPDALDVVQGLPLVCDDCLEELNRTVEET